MRKVIAAFLASALLLSYVTVDAQEGDGKTGGQYVPLESLLVNLDGRRHYLRADIQLLVEGPEQAEKIKAHMPAMRHALIMLFSGRNPDEVATVQEREKLRVEAKEALRRVLELHGAAEGLKDLFFTDFMVQ